MKTCDTCGETIAPQSLVCPYCETPQRPSPGAAPAGPELRHLDLEAGLPTVEEALRRLAAQLDRARADGVRVVRVVHGWGSASGGGGRIRTASRRWLREQTDARRIRGILFGDHFTHTSPEGREFLRRHPVLRASERTDRHNPGITFVEF
ncbi:MAG TPA: Smr/MutS family protein [Kiritimatiellia bacterium]|nr:Smr/MutS family protein [Kiritimatiellia bacterium]